MTDTLRTILAAAAVTGLVTGVATGLATAAVAADDPLSRVLSAVAVELSDAHIGPERAILVSSTDPDAAEADLYIYAGGPDEAMGSLIAHISGVAYDGSRTADTPSLTVSDKGSLLISSGHMGIGRAAWDRVVTVTERDGKIVLAGLTERVWDKVSNAGSTCDWNALTGDFVYQGQPVDDNGTELPPVTRRGKLTERFTLSDWAAAGSASPPACQDGGGE